METPVIHTDNLSFRFGQQLVVNDLNLEVPAGSIYGFLGPNGAGKTTTIKILLNLLQNSEGSVRIFGEELAKNRVSILKRIGSLIEQPALYGHLTGYENMYNRAMLLGIQKERINDLLSLVQLKDAARKKASAYSLGMKQRLGIALALIGNPDLLILDEPSNGLDPNGIKEIRILMKDLAENHGKTIFVSSHLLSEVEKTATHVGIINKGKLLFQGKISDLHQQNSGAILLQANDPERALQLLNEQGYGASLQDTFIQFPFSSNERTGAANTLLINKGVTVFSLNRQQSNLEELFMDLTNS